MGWFRDGRGLQTTSLGREDISLFISPARTREAQTTGKRGQMKRISETSGFIFGDPERKLQIDKSLLF